MIQVHVSARTWRFESSLPHRMSRKHFGCIYEDSYLRCTRPASRCCVLRLESDSSTDFRPLRFVVFQSHASPLFRTVRVVIAPSDSTRTRTYGVLAPLRGSCVLHLEFDSSTDFRPFRLVVFQSHASPLVSRASRNHSTCSQLWQARPALRELCSARLVNTRCVCADLLLWRIRPASRELCSARLSGGRCGLLGAGGSALGM